MNAIWKALIRKKHETNWSPESYFCHFFAAIFLWVGSYRVGGKQLVDFFFLRGGEVVSLHSPFWFIYKEWVSRQTLQSWNSEIRPRDLTKQILIHSEFRILPTDPNNKSAANGESSPGVTRIMRTLGGDPNLCNAKGLPPVYEACAKLQGSSNKESPLHGWECGSLKVCFPSIQGWWGRVHYVISLCKHKESSQNLCPGLK